MEILKSLVSLLGTVVNGDYDGDSYDDVFSEGDRSETYALDPESLGTHLHFGNSTETGSYDPDTDTATFPDGTTVESPHQDSYGQIYKTTEDWINGQNPYSPQ